MSAHIQITVTVWLAVWKDNLGRPSAQSFPTEQEAINLLDNLQLDDTSYSHVVEDKVSIALFQPEDY